jgi:hypothetical protein
VDFLLELMVACLVLVDYAGDGGEMAASRVVVVAEVDVVEQAWKWVGVGYASEDESSFSGHLNEIEFHHQGGVQPDEEVGGVGGEKKLVVVSESCGAGGDSRCGEVVPAVLRVMASYLLPCKHHNKF